jgi:hypothetical protein
MAEEEGEEAALEEAVFVLLLPTADGCRREGRCAWRWCRKARCPVHRRAPSSNRAAPLSSGLSTRAASGGGGWENRGGEEVSKPKAPSIHNSPHQEKQEAAGGREGGREGGKEGGDGWRSRQPSTCHALTGFHSSQTSSCHTGAPRR